ncbi:MAG: AAA family ATPase [Lachnospiraceae bacterium]|nr:AAA family ATPase [Lachnospiraceae bacterium]
MSDYIARVSLNYDYAGERLEELGAFWNDYLAALKEKHYVEMILYRFTFATFTVDRDIAASAHSTVKPSKDDETVCIKTKEDFRMFLLSTWEKSIGKASDIADILISDYSNDEDEISKTVRSIYNNYYGVLEYDRLVCEMSAMMPLLSEAEAKDIIRQQNYLFALDPGCGFTSLICSFGDFLHRIRVYNDEEYENRTLYGEILVGSETGNGYESQDDIIEKLDSIVDDNTYDILGFDISYFLEGRKMDELRRFIRRLDRYQDDFIFAFRIPFLEKRAFDEVAGILSDLMLLKTIQIPPLHDSVLAEQIWNMLTDKKFTPDTKILSTALDRIHQEKTDGRFYGFKTAEKIGYEIILTKVRDVIDKERTGIETSHLTIETGDIAKLARDTGLKATGYEALKELIGMEEIAGRIRDIVAQVKVAMVNEKLDRPCIHMRFTGAPGTGKTTVARIIGQIMREEGILRKGGFFEYTGRDLVAEYVGQTAVKTARICRDSYGSVLFVDEAYALYQNEYQGNDFGREALTTLISEMENHRDDMLVVMAGYTDEMDTLMKANPGLRSRMPYVLEFKSYSKQQLFEIFMLMVRKHFTYHDDLEDEAKAYFTGLSDEYIASKEFANARFVRNLYERTWSKAALRASLAGTTDITLTKEDFIAARCDREFSEKLEQHKVVGF